MRLKDNMKQELINVFSSVDASVDHNGSAIVSSYLLFSSMQAVVTGTSTGTLKLQYSNDIVNPIIPNGAAPSNWSDIPSATVAIAGAGVYSIPKTDLCYQFIRAVFTHTNAASGTLSANLKSIGD